MILNGNIKHSTMSSVKKLIKNIKTRKYTMYMAFMCLFKYVYHKTNMRDLHSTFNCKD